MTRSHVTLAGGASPDLKKNSFAILGLICDLYKIFVGQLDFEPPLEIRLGEAAHVSKPR